MPISRRADRATPASDPESQLRVGPPGAGRHRRRQAPSRPVLLILLAVLTLLLGSGTAISLTAASPTPPPAGPDFAALGAAPATEAPATGTPDRAPSATPPAPSPVEPAPEPPGEETGQQAGSGSSGGDSGGGEPADEQTALEDEVTRLTNAERSAGGCGEVGTDERLRTAARGHSQDMAVNDYFSHTGQDGRSPFDRMADAGYPDPAGENIAYGYRTPADVVEGWMNSDGHRRNILTCSHQAIGVGLAYDADGRPYWTQVFGR